MGSRYYGLAILRLSGGRRYKRTNREKINCSGTLKFIPTIGSVELYHQFFEGQVSNQYKQIYAK